MDNLEELRKYWSERIERSKKESWKVVWPSFAGKVANLTGQDCLIRTDAKPEVYYDGILLTPVIEGMGSFWCCVDIKWSFPRRKRLWKLFSKKGDTVSGIAKTTEDLIEAIEMRNKIWGNERYEEWNLEQEEDIIQD